MRGAVPESWHNGGLDKGRRSSKGVKHVDQADFAMGAFEACSDWVNTVHETEPVGSELVAVYASHQHEIERQNGMLHLLRVWLLVLQRGIVRAVGLQEDDTMLKGTSPAAAVAAAAARSALVNLEALRWLCRAAMMYTYLYSCVGIKAG